MALEITPDRARAARLAVSVLFFANGAISASVLPRLPAIKDALGLSNGELGIAVAAGPVGGLLAGGFVGLLIARFGSGRVALIAGTITALLLAGVGLAGSFIVLAAAFLVMGAFDATMDAAMNAHGIGVERRYRRSILQGFHGTWSLGSMAAGAIGAIAAGMLVPVAVHLGLVAVVVAVAVLVSARWLLPAAVADAHPEDADAVAPEPLTLAAAPRLLRILVPIALLGILCVVLQNAAASWSAVFLVDILDQPEGLAATAYVLYMAAMVLGRLTNDRWVDRFGRTPVVRAGALMGALGVAAAMASAVAGGPLLAFAGFALIGLGSSPMFPVMVGVAGTRPGIPAGHGVALVAWMVRFGLMFAPATIGIAADAFGLTAAFVIPLLAALAIAAAATPLTGGRDRRIATPVPTPG